MKYGAIWRRGSEQTSPVVCPFCDRHPHYHFHLETRILCGKFWVLLSFDFGLLSLSDICRFPVSIWLMSFKKSVALLVFKFPIFASTKDVPRWLKKLSKRETNQKNGLVVGLGRLVSISWLPTCAGIKPLSRPPTLLRPSVNKVLFLPKIHIHRKSANIHIHWKNPYLLK